MRQSSIVHSPPNRTRCSPWQSSAAASSWNNSLSYKSLPGLTPAPPAVYDGCFAAAASPFLPSGCPSFASRLSVSAGFASLASRRQQRLLPALPRLWASVGHYSAAVASGHSQSWSSFGAASSSPWLRSCLCCWPLLCLPACLVWAVWRGSRCAWEAIRWLAERFWVMRWSRSFSARCSGSRRRVRLMSGLG